MGVFYVNCIGKNGVPNKEECFHKLSLANDCYEERKEENKYAHIEITEQLKVYLDESNEEF